MNTEPGNTADIVTVIGRRQFQQRHFLIRIGRLKLLGKLFVVIHFFPFRQCQVGPQIGTIVQMSSHRPVMGNIIRTGQIAFHHRKNGTLPIGVCQSNGMNDSLHEEIENTPVLSSCGNIVHRVIVESGKSGVRMSRRNHDIGLIKNRNPVFTLKYDKPSVMKPVTAPLQNGNHRFPHCQ